MQQKLFNLVEWLSQDPRSYTKLYRNFYRQNSAYKAFLHKGFVHRVLIHRASVHRASVHRAFMREDFMQSLYNVVLQHMQRRNNKLKFLKSNNAVLLIAVNLVTLAITNNIKYYGD